MAIVATGTPEGIWTMARRESCPFKAEESKGTPITAGWILLPAPGQMGGRPGAGNQNLEAFFFGLAANSAVFLGERWAELTMIS